MADENIESGNSGDESGATGGNSGAIGGASGSPAVVQPEYASKADLDAFRAELRQSRQAPQAESRRDASPSAPKEPNPADYKFDKPGELARYNRDNHRYNKFLDDQEDAPKRASETTAAKIRENAIAHETRMADYRKANPSFDADLKAAAGKLNVLDQVKHAVFASKNSAYALHYLAKNPDSARELDFLMESDGIEAVRERIGEMAAEMKSQSRGASENERAASVRVPKQSFRGGANSSNRKKSAAESFEEYNS